MQRRHDTLGRSAATSAPAAASSVARSHNHQLQSRLNEASNAAHFGAFASAQFPSTASSMATSLFSYGRSVAGSVSMCSIRDAEQGIYEYLAEKHEPPASASASAAVAVAGLGYGGRVKLPKPFSIPIRISGWLWRKEGLFRKFRRRFCVFKADVATLFVFANDDTTTGKLLGRFVVTQVTLADKAAREFRVQGYVQEREIHKKHSDSMARRRSSLPKVLPGDQQRFYLPEYETLRAVGDKSLSVWAHCFRNHMKSATRMKRLRRSGVAHDGANGYGGGESSEEDDDEDLDDDTDDDINPDFQFEEPERSQRRRSQPGRTGVHSTNGSRYTRPTNNNSDEEDEVSDEMEGDYDDDDEPIQFDQQENSGLRITASYQALPSTTFFESHEGEDRYTGESLKEEISHFADSSGSTRSDVERIKQPLSSTSSASAIGSSSSSRGSDVRSAGSIWHDEELLSYRVDFDAIQKQRQLSVGAFGEVWLAKYRATQLVVVKHLKGDSSDQTRRDIQLFVREIKTMCKLKHKRIVAFLGVAWTMERDVQLMMEFVSGGDLRAYLDRVKRSGDADGFRSQWTWTKHQWRVAIDVIEALVYLHSLNPALLHCDIKSHNVLLGADMRAKLTDFGISRYYIEPDAIKNEAADDSADSHASLGSSGWDGLGTGRWMAPEILSSDAGYSVASDMYAFGIVLSEIDTCEMPFHDRIAAAADGGGERVVISEDILVHQIVGQGWRPSFSGQCPAAVRELALQCLALDPRERPTSLEVAYRLRKAASQSESVESLISQTTTDGGERSQRRR